jgi:hypothetical protein
MDLYKEWDTLNRTKFNNPTLNKQEIMEAINQQSHLTLAELQKKLRIKINFALCLTAIQAIWMLFSLTKPDLLIIISVPLLLSIIGLIATVSYYKKLKINNLVVADVTSTIKTNITITKSILRFETMTSLFGLPISVLTGTLAANFYMGHTLVEFSHNQIQLLTTIICLVVLVPLGLIFAAKMNEKAFGEHLQQLQENVRELEVLN